VNSLALSSVLGVFAWFFWNFLEPGSAPFYGAIAFLLIIIALVLLKYYYTSLLAFAALLCLVPILSISASYYIASDQFRLRYRTVEGTPYLEFPGQLSLLMTVVRSLAAKRLIEVTHCGDFEVAKLPLLPYKPLFLRSDVIDGIGFRRFPELQFEGIQLTVGTSTGQATLSDGKQRTSVGFEIGVASTDPATISLTAIFPRSLQCIKNQIPLLPIVEVLPWNPDETGSLIKAAIRVSRFRGLYPDRVLSIDSLLQLRMKDDDSQYSALMDFLIDSLAYEAFNGNVFAETRADFANSLCIVVENRKSAFAGPFSSLPDNFLWRLVSEMGPKYQIAAPACHVADNLVKAYQRPSKSEPPPFYATFKRCVETAKSIKQCLAEDAAPEPKLPCDDPSCNSNWHDIPNEAVFQVLDEKFSTMVATQDNALVDITTIKPSECPKLRDSGEEDYFVRWWINHANGLASEPMQCSSQEWQHRYTISREELRTARACALQRQVRSVQQIEGIPETLELLYGMKCNGTVDADRTAFLERIFSFYDQLGLLILKLQGYSTLINDRRIDRLVSAFKMFAEVKQKVCETRNAKACSEEYTVWQDYQGLMNNILGGFGIFNVTDAPQIIRALTGLNNVIVDMGVCDLLQDEEIKRSTGIDRDAYCDDHGLRQYRLIGSRTVAHSIERADGAADGSMNYWYESDGSHNGDLGIKLFLKK
jgi:hypothetical protein